MVAAALLAFAVAGCSGGSGSAIKLDGDTSAAGAAIDHVPVHQPQVFTTFSLCVTHGPLSVSGVTLVQPTGGITLVDWGVRKFSADTWSNGLPTSEPGRALSLPSFGQDAISGSCGGKQNGSMLAFSVESATAKVAKADGVRVAFRSDGSTHSVLVPYHVALCIAACPKHPWDDGFV